MATTSVVRTVLDIIGAAAVSLILIALMFVGADAYRSSVSRCTDYGIQHSVVVSQCLRADRCAVTPNDIVDALRTEHDYPQCFHRPKVEEVPHDKETVQATRAP